MARTTVDLEAPILSRLKAIGQQEGRSLGNVISELVAEALAHRSEQPAASFTRLRWISKPMESTIDWGDTAALAAILDEDDLDDGASDVSGGAHDAP